ncbi:hypothetical protein ILYODFUR_031227 [Ilyodon furcidens]|uniref:Secreted protein n=1 Tax=Ilyodon furcidens TaxID=33524 RepID=A0ABV0TZ90_9TELE
MSECVWLFVLCVSVLPCDGLATCPGWTPPLTRRKLETGTSSSPPATLYRRTRSVRPSMDMLSQTKTDPPPN